MAAVLESEPSVRATGDPRTRRNHGTPAVSVVVPCYNGGRFVGALVRSLAAQTFQDFEIIVVDDGSTDQTPAHLAALEPGIRVVRQTNAGPGAARNAGFRHARGELIFIIDCDDTIEPTFLEETIRALRAAGPKAGFAFSHERKLGHRVQINHCYFKLFDQLFVNRVPSCMVVRREAWEAVGGFDASMRDGYEDWEFTVALGRAGYDGVAAQKVLFNYHTREDGLMMTRSTHMHGTLWARIREKHREAYRLPALLRLWWTTRTEPGRLSLAEALAILAVAKALPGSWFTALTHLARTRRVATRGGSPVRSGGHGA